MKLDEMIDKLGNEKAKKLWSRQRKSTPMVFSNRFSFLDSLPAQGKQSHTCDHIKIFRKIFNAMKQLNSEIGNVR